MKYVKTFEQFVNEERESAISEAMTPEEKKEKRKARRLAKKQAMKSSSNKNMDADIEDIENMIEVEPSKSMAQAVERYKAEMIKFQELQKEFVMTSKDNVAKREILKKKLVAQSKISKKAEADFEKIVSKEDEDADGLFF
tara:strand:+ start:11429 stop:11848 length:420 start_codon:yes stop_codon:yes gene_type:complete